jgi:hypothetical protein
MVSALLSVPASFAAETLGFALSAQTTSSTEMTVTVLDEAKLKPVADATVSVSDGAQANATQVLSTDASGIALVGNLQPGLRSVTVAKAGFAAISVAGIDNANITFYLKALPKAVAQPLLSGNSSGWEPAANSSLVYAGITFRSLSVYDLSSFQAEGLVSPLKDHIDVMGDREIPSNLVLPRQDVRVSIFTVHLDKPKYRLPLTAGRETSLVLLQGNIPAKTLMDAAQNGGESAYLDVINKLKMSRVGLGSPFTPTKDATQDVTSTIALAPKHQVTPATPPFSANVLAAAVTDTVGDRTLLVPTDVKISAKAGEAVKAVTLAAPSQAFGKTQNVITLAQDTKSNRVSGIVSAQAGKTLAPGEFLNVAPLASLPSLPATISVTAPSHGLGALVFNSLPAKGDAASFPVWYAYALPGAGPQSFSTAPLAGLKKLSDYSSLQFEFDAKKIDLQNLNGRDAMTGLKRFTRATATVANAHEPQLQDLSAAPNGFYDLFRALTGLFAL